jgi:cell division protein FtsB
VPRQRFEEEEDDSPGLWTGLSRVVKVLLAVAAIALVFALFIPELRRQREQNAFRDRLAAEKKRQEELLARQTREADLLKRDPAYVETIARDRLELMKPGETVIRFEDRPPSAAPTPTPRSE